MLSDIFKEFKSLHDAICDATSLDQVRPWLAQWPAAQCSGCTPAGVPIPAMVIHPVLIRVTTCTIYRVFPRHLFRDNLSTGSVLQLPSQPASHASAAGVLRRAGPAVAAACHRAFPGHDCVHIALRVANVCLIALCQEVLVLTVSIYIYIYIYPSAGYGARCSRMCLVDMRYARSKGGGGGRLGQDPSLHYLHACVGFDEIRVACCMASCGPELISVIATSMGVLEVPSPGGWLL
jgi:hypothetical protein